jgi:hypothetical protein
VPLYGCDDNVLIGVIVAFFMLVCKRVLFVIAVSICLLMKEKAPELCPDARILE